MIALLAVGTDYQLQHTTPIDGLYCSVTSTYTQYASSVLPYTHTSTAAVEHPPHVGCTMASLLRQRNDSLLMGREITPLYDVFFTSVFSQTEASVR